MTFPNKAACKVFTPPSRVSQWQVLLGWLVAAFSALSVLFGLWKYNTLALADISTYTMDPMTAIVYGSLHRQVGRARG